MRAHLPAICAIAAASTLGATACTRDEAPAVCPDLAAGDLVVTEIRGPQTDESGPPFVELFNASGGAIDLLGTRIRFRTLDGSTDLSAIVRHALPAPAGSYTVLALTTDTALPAGIDYGFSQDFQGASWLASAAVDVLSCDTMVDRARYDSLPRAGTYSLGTMPPTAEANDLPAAWCTDPAGSPQAANHVCP